MPSPVSPALLANLRNIKKPAPSTQADEYCDFCRKPIPAAHKHLLSVHEIRFMCACELCAVLQAVQGDYKLIPQRSKHLQDFDMPNHVWDEFLIPVNMAFFVFSAQKEGVVAYYPAAAGATESKLKMEPWKKLEELNPVLKNMLPDVEALLVNRLEDEPAHYLVPIDKCYELVGVIRSNWQGIHGGKQAQEATVKFFNDLKKNTAHA